MEPRSVVLVGTIELLQREEAFRRRFDDNRWAKATPEKKLRRAWV
jgi:hypothetical protein